MDALHRLGNNSVLLNKIMESFINDGVNSFTAMKEALMQNNSESVQLHAHSLKGSAGNVGALKLQEISKRLEEFASSKSLHEVHIGIDECELVLRETLNRFKIHLAKEVLPSVRKKRLDPLQMAIKLQGIKKNIQDGTFIDTNATGIFVEYTDEVLTQNMVKLKGHINAFDNEKATQLIEQIMADLT
jgi:HPt (histidine-containing phosphotransfer) domain-containing protein